MKTLMSVAVVSVLVVSSLAFAGEMTPEETMMKMMNCVACKPYGEYPQVMQNIRYDIFDTSNGFVVAFLMANEEHVGDFRACEEKCEAARAEAAKLSAEEKEAQLCPFCVGMFKLKGRDDITFEKFDAQLGQIMVASSNTDEGVKALHAYSDNSRKTNKMLEEAAKKMKAEKKAAETKTGE
ncbi:MAG: hypothetical protein JSW58_10855 [Candidatus Latescibacterota bacterium]|nr:MAG: hypothetical protein JSW58_10855 [Candidatus Latescibacterota bacterium]